MKKEQKDELKNQRKKTSDKRKQAGKTQKKKSAMKQDERVMTQLLLLCLVIVILAVAAVAIYSAVVDRDPDASSSQSVSDDTGKNGESEEDFRVGNIGYTLTGNGEVEVYFYYNESGAEIDDLTVPETVEHDGRRYTVTAFSDHAFLDVSPALVVIPKTVRSIGIECFGDTQNISIVYCGSPEQWEAIEMDEDMNSGWLDTATVTFDE